MGQSIGSGVLSTPGEALTAYAIHREVVYHVVLRGAVRPLMGAFAAVVSLARRLRVARRQAEAGNRGKGEFPANRSHEIRTPIPDPPPDAPASAGLDRLRALIVDHNEIHRRILHLQVEGWGMRDTSFASIPPALEEIREAQRTGNPYHFLIADFQMPDRDGASLAAAVKKDPATRNTIVVMLASIGSWGELQGLDCGHVDACLLKPVRQYQLLEALSSAWSRRSLAALAAQVEQHAGCESDHSPARVLVADGNAANRKSAVRMLESLGLRADVSANGPEAVEMLRLLSYDLVLMACQMPLMNGQQAAIEIRKREPPERRTPIIAVTAETGAACLDDCLASGMDDILLKPVRREQLTATLRRWLPRLGEASRSGGCCRE